MLNCYKCIDILIKDCLSGIEVGQSLCTTCIYSKSLLEINIVEHLNAEVYYLYLLNKHTK